MYDKLSFRKHFAENDCYCRFDTHRRRQAIKNTRVRPKRRRVARYLEGGWHHRKGKAEEPEIDPRREKAESSCSQGRRVSSSSSSSNNKKSLAVSSQKFEPNGSSQGTSSENACGTSSRKSQIGAVALSGLGAPSTARAGEKARRRRPGSAIREQSGRESEGETRAQEI